MADIPKGPFVQSKSCQHPISINETLIKAHLIGPRHLPLCKPGNPRICTHAIDLLCTGSRRARYEIHRSARSALWLPRLARTYDRDEDHHHHHRGGLATPHHGVRRQRSRRSRVGSTGARCAVYCVHPVFCGEPRGCAAARGTTRGQDGRSGWWGELSRGPGTRRAVQGRAWAEWVSPCVRPASLPCSVPVPVL